MQSRDAWKKSFDARRVKAEIEATTEVPRWHGPWKAFTWIAIAASAYFLIFRTSYGQNDKNNVFTPVRAWHDQQIRKYWALPEYTSPTEKEQ